jgi:RND family efflux transporter MFP subunit
LLVACGKPETAPPEAPRPVRTIIAGAGSLASTSIYSGEVRSRFESKLGFRTTGKIVSRLVEVGSHVRSGQPLLRMDVVQETLQVAASDADVEAAQSRVTKLRLDLDRTEQLLSRKFASQAELDQQRQALAEAEAGLKSAKARQQFNINQRGYAELKAERDGVVTTINAEVGQVVTAGQPLVTVAAEGEREVLVSVPESRIDEMRNAKNLRVTAWALPGKQWPGTLRELAPDADSVTRTYLARVSVRNADPSLRLGMTASVQLTDAVAAGSTVIRLPLTAIYDRSGQPQVWIVDRKTSIVATRKVVLGNPQNDDVWVNSGVIGGETVVTTGVHLLTEGQKVRLLETAPVAVQASGIGK